MVDMMPDDMPNTDDKPKRKIHPLAKVCLIISLVLAAPIALQFALTLSVYFGIPLGFFRYFYLMGLEITVPVFFLLILEQPIVILLGVYSLVQVRKGYSCRSIVYAIAGIVISILTLAAFVYNVLWSLNHMPA